VGCAALTHPTRLLDPDMFRSISTTLALSCDNVLEALLRISFQRRSGELQGQLRTSFTDGNRENVRPSFRTAAFS
jgi:hypothetical protein